MQGEASDGFTLCLEDLLGHCWEYRRKEEENMLQHSSEEVVGAWSQRATRMGLWGASKVEAVAFGNGLVLMSKEEEVCKDDSWVCDFSK